MIISHNLHDIFEVADRITVLRLGQKVAVLERPRPTSRTSSTPSPPATLPHVPGMATSMTDLLGPSRARPLMLATDAAAAEPSETFGGYVQAGGGRASGPATSDRCRSSSGSSSSSSSSGCSTRVLHGAELHQPAAADGGDRDDRDRRRLRAADRRDRPLGRLRQRRRRACMMTLLLRPGRPGLAVVGRDPHRPVDHDADRVPPRA